jgi:hypothetical protein
VAEDALRNQDVLVWNITTVELAQNFHTTANYSNH